MYFSVIIPVYNRPAEVAALLESLSRQIYRDFEVLVIEDGSDLTCASEAQAFNNSLDLTYHVQSNTGQGFARNKGMELARGDYFVFFDSDCLVPPDYLKILNEAILMRALDAHGGADDADAGFSDWQKAMNFSMTSFLTTGGIRGKMKNPAKYQARGYNMGFSRKVYERLGGFAHPNMAEDIELSMRIKKAGFSLELIKEASVFHRRKNSLESFLRQSYQFGRNRVFIRRFHPEAVKWVHLLPVLFLFGFVMIPVLYLLFPGMGLVLAGIYGFWTVAVFVAAFESLLVALLSVLTSYGQLLGYGLGIIREFLFPTGGN